MFQENRAGIDAKLSSGADVTAWLALATHPHKERVALDNLARQGFQTYCPMLRKRVRHARRVQEVLRPFFPGYIFAGVNGAMSWRSMHSTVGVRQVIAFGEHPSVVAHSFITALRSREVDGAIVRPTQDYRIGQQVRLVQEPMEGLVATIVNMDEKQRLVVLIDMLCQSVRLHTDAQGVREL